MLGHAGTGSPKDDGAQRCLTGGKSVEGSFRQGTIGAHRHRLCLRMECGVPNATLQEPKRVRGSGGRACMGADSSGAQCREQQLPMAYGGKMNR